MNRVEQIREECRNEADEATRRRQAVTTSILTATALHRVEHPDGADTRSAIPGVPCFLCGSRPDNCRHHPDTQHIPGATSPECREQRAPGSQVTNHEGTEHE